MSRGTWEKTEGIKYAGSKLRLLPDILGLMPETGARSVFDGFSGTTRVSQALARSGYRVVANDLADWSTVFGTAYLLNEQPASHYQALIDHLNHVKPLEGWFTAHYGGRDFQGLAIQPDGTKKPWQIHNTAKLDGIREELDRLSLTDIERAVGMTSLILALDRVDSSLGHFTSYLRDWSPRSFQDLELKVPAVWQQESNHAVCQGDVLETLATLDTPCDLAYYDPPYGSNNEKMPPSRVRYAAYYHLWTTICRNDRPALFGKALRRSDSSDRLTGSPFEEFRRNDSGRFIAVEAIDQLLEQTPCPWILLSYSSGGRATAAELNDVLHRHGKLVRTVEIHHRRHVMASMHWTGDWLKEAEEPNREFLFLLRKQ